MSQERRNHRPSHSLTIRTKRRVGRFGSGGAYLAWPKAILVVQTHYRCADRLVSVRGQFDSFESFVIHSPLGDSIEVADVDQRKSWAV